MRVGYRSGDVNRVGSTLSEDREEPGDQVADPASDRHAVEGLMRALLRLSELTARLHAASTASEIAELLAAHGQAAVQADGSVVALAHDGGLTPIATSGRSDELEGLTSEPLDGDGIVPATLRTGEALWVAETDRQPAQGDPASAAVDEWLARLRASVGLEGIVVIPLTGSDGGAIGVLACGYLRPYPFNTFHRGALAVLGTQSAIALERLAARDGERAAIERATLLSTHGAALATAITADDVGHATLDALRRGGATAGAVHVVRGGAVGLLAAWADTPGAGALAAVGEVRDSSVRREVALRASSGDVIGSLMVATPGGPPRALDARTIDAIVQQCADALHRALLHDDLVAATQRANALERLARGLFGVTGRDRLRELATAELAQLFDDRVTVAAVGELDRVRGDLIWIACHPGPAVLGRTAIVDLSGSTAGDAVRTGEVHLVDATTDTSGPAGPTGPSPSAGRSFAPCGDGHDATWGGAWPLAAEDAVLGVLSVAWRTGRPDRATLGFVETVAELLGQALGRLQALERSDSLRTLAAAATAVTTTADLRRFAVDDLRKAVGADLVMIGQQDEARGVIEWLEHDEVPLLIRERFSPCRSRCRRCAATRSRPGASPSPPRGRTSRPATASCGTAPTASTSPARRRGR